MAARVESNTAIRGSRTIGVHPTSTAHRPRLLLLGLLAIATTLPAGARAAVVTVSSGGLAGWDISNFDDSTATAIGAATTASGTHGEFVNGPGTPPAGTGSFHQKIGTDGNDAQRLRTSQFNGTPLTALTTLTYATYVAGGGSGGQATYIQLYIDRNGDGSTDDVLFFEPVYQNGTYGLLPYSGPVPNQCGANPGCVVVGSWQAWNAASGGWWSNVDSAGGPPLTTLADYAAHYPGAKLATDVPALRLTAGFGSGAWDNFDGNVDDLTVNGTTFDLEGCTVTATRYVAVGGSDTANDCTNAGTPCATVQDAVDIACPNDTVNVSAGTYTEQVSVAKSLTVIGAGAAATTIQAPGTLPARGNLVTVEGTGVSVDLSGVTVSGPGPGGCGSIGAGILVRDGANATIHDNTVSNIRDNPLSGCQNGWGIEVGDHDGSTPATATITHNSIVGYQKNGVDLRNAASFASVSDNTVSGAGAQNLIAQNGVVVVDAGASVSSNSISGNQCNHASCGPDPVNQAQSVGVLLVAAQPNTTVAGNEVTGNDVGIYNNAGGPTAITRNRLAGNRYEGIFLDQGTATVTSNDVQDGNIAVVAVSFTGNTGDSAATLSCNHLTGAGTGIELIDQNLSDGVAPVVTANANAIDGNGTGIDNTTAASMNAQGNWWGCAAGPGNPGCDTVAGPVDASSPAATMPACTQSTTVSDCTGMPDGTACNGGVDVCQAGVCVGVDSLGVAAVRLRRNSGHLTQNGSAFVSALVDDNDTGGLLSGNLLGGGVSVDVTDGGAFQATLALTNCQPRLHGAISCSDKSTRTTARFVRVRYFNRTYGFVYRMTARRRGLGTAATGTGQPQGPVQVVLHQGPVDRPASLSTCGPLGVNLLLCHN